MKKKIISIIKDNIALKKAVLDTQTANIEQAARLMISCLKKGGKIMLFGNGGSAADCQHIAAELVGRFKKERPALAAISLSTDTSVITSLANDYSYDAVFARQVEALGKFADVAFAISTSGNSRNVLEAVRLSRKKGIRVIGMTGAKGGSLAALADVCINVPSEITARIQESHILIGHILCQLIEDEIVPFMLSRADVLNAAGSRFKCEIGEAGHARRDRARLKLTAGQSNDKFVSRKLLTRLVAKYRNTGKTIAFTNGCFDILHLGHVDYLEKAKALADILIVGLNSDSSVRKIKGKSRPINSQTDRAGILSGLASVDFVTVFSQQTPIGLIKLTKPDILVKGGDWRREDIVGYDFVKSYGGKVRTIPFLKDRSTSGLIKKISRS